jgi:hypothetical protein
MMEGLILNLPAPLLDGQEGKDVGTIINKN